MRSCGTCKDRTKCKVEDVKVCSSNGYCNYAPENISSNNKYTAPQATPKSCKICGGSPVEKRSGQNYCPYCESYF